MKKRILLILCVCVIGLFANYSNPSASKMVSAQMNWKEWNPKYNVSPEKTFTIEFNQEINKDTIAKSTVYVLDQDGEAVQNSLKISEDQKSVQIHPPEEEYQFGKTYTLYISNVTSNNGTKVKPVKMDFTIQQQEEKTVTKKDDQGQSFDVTGNKSVVENVTISRNEAVSSTEIVEEKIGVPLDEHPIRFDIGEENSATDIAVKTIFSENPSALIRMDPESKKGELIPFSTDEQTNETSFSIDQSSEIIPVFKTTFSIQSKSNQIKKMFNIVQNENGRIVVDVSELAREFSGAEITYVFWKGDRTERMTDLIKVDQNKHLIKENVEESGIYKFDLYIGTLQIWSQDIFVEFRDEDQWETIQHLAEKYSPVVVNHPDEDYFPMKIEEIFAPLSTEINIKIPSIRGGINIPYSQMNKFMPFNGHSDYLLNMSKENIKVSSDKDVFNLRNRQGDFKDADVYYSILERGNKYYINYHFFYAFDPKVTKEIFDKAAHNFDRESMTVVVDKESKKAIDVVFGGHLDSQTMQIIGEDGKAVQSWKGGRVKVDYAEAYQYEGHPLVFLARGAHALYPVNANEYKVVNGGKVGDLVGATLSEPAGIMKSVRSNFESSVLLPNVSDIKTGLTKYTLHELPLHRIISTSNDEVGFLAFSGEWVDGYSAWGNAKFPPFTGREGDIVSWVEDAYEWDQNVVPKNSIKATKELLSILKEKTITVEPNDLGKLKKQTETIGREIEDILHNGVEYTYNGIKKADFVTLKDGLEELATEDFMSGPLQDYYENGMCTGCDSIWFPWRVATDVWFKVLESSPDKIVIETAELSNEMTTGSFIIYTFEKVKDKWLLDNYDWKSFGEKGMDLSIPQSKEYLKSYYLNSEYEDFETVDVHLISPGTERLYSWYDDKYYNYTYYIFVIDTDKDDFTVKFFPHDGYISFDFRDFDSLSLPEREEVKFIELLPNGMILVEKDGQKMKVHLNNIRITSGSELQHLLTQAKKVELEYDVMNKDSNGNIHAYVYADGTFINEWAIQQGDAYLYNIHENTRYLEQLIKVQNNE